MLLGNGEEYDGPRKELLGDNVVSSVYNVVSSVYRH